MKVAQFRFDEGLRLLLQHDHSRGAFDYQFSGPQSAKHLIESVGIPHTEIGSVLANGIAADPGYLVQSGDVVEVFGNPPGREWVHEPRFVLDGHLGRLAAHLRMLGLDCHYQNDIDDAELASISVAEERILLTRDRRLLMHKSLTRGYLLRSLEPHEQLLEVLHRYALRKWIRPFQRCIRCNHPLEPVEKEAIIERLEPLTKLYFHEFRICPACQQIYWKGSHFERMQKLIASLES
jgi:uncharacterized protein with PIN domain